MWILPFSFSGRTAGGSGEKSLSDNGFQESQLFIGKHGEKGTHLRENMKELVWRQDIEETAQQKLWV